MDKRLKKRLKGNLAIPVISVVLAFVSLIATFLCLQESPIKYNACDLSTYVGRCDRAAYEVVGGLFSGRHSSGSRYAVLYMEDGKMFHVRTKLQLYKGWETMLDPGMDQFGGKQLKLTYDNRDTHAGFGYKLVAVESADGETVYLSTSQTESENLKYFWCWIGVVGFFLFFAGLMLYLSASEYFVELKEDRAREKRKKREKEKAKARKERYLHSPESFKCVKNKKK